MYYIEHTKVELGKHSLLLKFVKCPLSQTTTYTNIKHFPSLLRAVPTPTSIDDRIFLVSGIGTEFSKPISSEQKQLIKATDWPNTQPEHTFHKHISSVAINFRALPHENCTDSRDDIRNTVDFPQNPFWQLGL